MTILDLGAWCILRCLGADTIKLAAALNLRGLRVWTPTEWSIGRMPKTRARYDKPTPMIAGYAFGDVRDIDELYRLAAIRDREIPHFRFLKSETLAGHTPLVADTELTCLRDREARLRENFELSKRKNHKPPKPLLEDEVRMPDGPFAGITGDVKRTKGRDIVVDIPDCPFTIKVSSLLALESVAKDGLPQSRAA